jgi:outer membrane protein assembly factor BamD
MTFVARCCAAPVQAGKAWFLAPIRVAVLLAVVLPLAGCDSLSSFDPFGLFGGSKYVTKIEPQIPPETMYNQALARLYAKDYDGAAKEFDKIETQYPYTQWSRKALLMQTFSQYQGGSYDDAISTAQRYIALYPDEDDTDYAYYLEAMSNYNSIPDISRDQERAQTALALFTDIVQKYPKSEYVDDAKYKIQVTRDQLAGKEMAIGRYYLEARDYPAAINRFHDVIAKYQTTREAEEALYRLTEAYLAMGVVDEAQTAAAVLGHNFPDSEWYKDAYALLQGKGLRPDENHDSWISKVFRGIGLG